MPQATRDIKRRIKSVASTKKVTKAMEMVSAAKMRRAVAGVLASRSYSDLAWQLVSRLVLESAGELHPLLTRREKVKKAALVMISGNRGLCGGFNAQIIQRTNRYLKEQSDKGIDVSLITVGKKGRDFMAKKNYPLVADFIKADATVDITEIRPLAHLLIEGYLAGQFDKVALAYTDFISALVQKPTIIEILPLPSSDGNDLGRVSSQLPISNFPGPSEAEGRIAALEYLFEPSPVEVLNELLPRMLETKIYQAVLEANASEHSARMVAMRNASEAAGDMISELTLIFNKARQAGITAELADISGGRAAVE